MKRDLVMGWVFIALCLLMVFCIAVSCVNQNWANLPICLFALFWDAVSAVNHFKNYKRHKEYENMYSVMSMRYWDDYDEDDVYDEDKDESEDTGGMLSSGSFIDN